MSLSHTMSSLINEIRELIEVKAGVYAQHTTYSPVHSACATGKEYSSLAAARYCPWSKPHTSDIVAVIGHVHLKKSTSGDLVAPMLVNMTHPAPSAEQ
jgi:hypothetical protein